MSKILVISGHPDLQASQANKAILACLSEDLDDIAIRRLDALYPDFRIDAAAEQQALLKADVVVLQFPLFWYASPALLKQWLDVVFSYGFAYGTAGDKLKGKHLLLSITIGGPESAYSPLGPSHFHLEQFLRPLEQTAYYTGMHHHAPIVSYGMIDTPDADPTAGSLPERAADHGRRLLARLRELHRVREPALA